QQIDSDACTKNYSNGKSSSASDSNSISVYPIIQPGHYHHYAAIITLESKAETAQADHNSVHGNSRNTSKLKFEQQ
uniref:Uncharacterized protein n=1 Tax=Leersia perrieri TaxID=77586 RepID=A0A0D9VZJ8_9ORYZ